MDDLSNFRESPAVSRQGWVARRQLPALAIGVALVAAVFGVTRLVHPGSAAAVPAPPPPEVTVSAPLSIQTANWAQFSGQFTAVDDVEIRAQVSGYLTEIHFTDGQIVHQGDLLFVVDPRPYQIQLAQAQAAVLTAQAQLNLANKELQRIKSLQDSGAVTVEQLDERVQQQVAARLLCNKHRRRCNPRSLICNSAMSRRHFPAHQHASRLRRRAGARRAGCYKLHLAHNLGFARSHLSEFPDERR